MGKGNRNPAPQVAGMAAGHHEAHRHPQAHPTAAGVALRGQRAQRRNPNRPYSGQRRPPGASRPQTATSGRPQNQRYQHGNRYARAHYHDKQDREMIEAGVDPDRYREILRRMIQNGNNYARRRPQTATTGAGLRKNELARFSAPTGGTLVRPNYASTAPATNTQAQKLEACPRGRGATPGDPWGFPVTTALGGRVKIDNENRDGPKQYGLEPYKHAVHLAVDFAAKMDPAKRERIFREHHFQPFDRYTHEESSVLSKYLLGEKLGHGAYATVRLGWCKANRASKVAVKIYEKISLVGSTTRRRNVMREIHVMKKISHPNIVQFIETFDTPKKMCYLILEHIAGGCLNEFVERLPGNKVDDATAKKSDGIDNHNFDAAPHGHFLELSVVKASVGVPTGVSWLRFMAQICEGVRYCHNKRIVHRDLKLENILLEGRDRIKIIDFGFSTSVPEGQNVKIFCGTPSYMCPQLVRGGEYNGFKADMWALGVIVYLILLGSFPFRANTQKELYVKIQKGRYYLPDPASPILTAGARLVIKRLLKADAVSRRPMTIWPTHSVAIDCLDVKRRNCENAAFYCMQTACRCLPRTGLYSLRMSAWTLTSSVLTPGYTVHSIACRMARLDSIRQATAAQLAAARRPSSQLLLIQG
ncbi:hypothetical protein FOZ62_028063 [Perkinsus olseni]|uniref:Protein kinase domain-containing protein n=1 Tax=Perkinsus olseni TaxID=32597 RepID=A0A7J6U1N5_PEROL|nr:hypothetical protein FOZ62_028063 [Perkinsus olseni]